MFEEDRVLMG